MALSSKLLINSTHKTKTWWTFLSVLVLVFIPFLIVWLLCGEFNLLENNWFVAKNASVWHGMLTAEKIPDLVARFAQFRPATPGLEAELNSWLVQHPNQQVSIDSAFTVFNPVVLAPLLGLLVWCVVYPMIFNAFKWSGLDIIPFSASIGSLSFLMIISGLIPHWGQNLIGLYWIVRILACFALSMAIFFISNVIINKWLASRDYAFDLVFGYKQLDEQTKNTRQQFKENVGIYKKNKDEEKSYVDVEEGK